MGEPRSPRSKLSMDMARRAADPKGSRLEDNGKQEIIWGEVTKVSAHLCAKQAWICIMFAALNIDRGNISNAVSDNMLDDLKLTQGDYVRSSLIVP